MTSPDPTLVALAQSMAPHLEAPKEWTFRAEWKGAEQLAALRCIVFDLANAIPGGPQPMYDAGRFTGWMNVLDPTSPHCAKDAERALEAFLELMAIVKATGAQA
jgi:hypothetical protein